MQPNLQNDMKRAKVIRQLIERFNYFDVVDKTYEQLVRKLVDFKKMGVDHDHPSDKWF
ncbi:hypothetical protein SAMN05421839_10211 [Halolactibacillus halophilus]|uniref:Uncharacterized protein n=1 Tax=Halolactibacillus halophilus TaxID=306540 RepID=A0A1I5LCR6_9BACI|nr:hypothetical protein [Halolactibacillus halophilus]GEM00881.1 hypothetical protein HHA03_04130 [Halolactibacillus halophilus]SFO95154.1 hypothetical protein SAMN05421839_10211 [Halolactibacillus halophilus]